MRLRDRIAVITGAGTGIGAATAELFAREGANQVLVGRRPEPLEEVAEKVRAEGRECLVVPADVSDEKQVRALFEAALERFGRIDVLFNNAGVGSGGPHSMVTFDEERYYRVTDINLKGVMLCCKYALPSMIERGSGSIINNASLAACHGVNSIPIYGAAKAAVVNLSQSMALEHGPQGVRTNAVSPGWIWTPMTASAAPELIEERKRSIPLGHRYADPMEVAYGVLYLACDEGGYVNGINLMIDGGLGAGRYQ